MAEVLQLAQGDTDGSDPVNMGRAPSVALPAPKADVNRAFTCPRVRGCLWGGQEEQQGVGISTQARVEFMAASGAVTAVGSVCGSSPVAAALVAAGNLLTKRRHNSH